jgi:purine nucleosidase
VKRLWIDTDIALGAPSGDVDDGFALAAVLRAARAGTIELAGVSAVSGNTDAITAARAASAFVGSVFEMEAAPAQIAALPDGTDIVALGPLTNIARALALDPTLARRTTIRLVGTVLHPLRDPALLLFDLNVKKDRRAARSIFGARWRRRRIYPLDVIRALRFGRAELDRLRSGSTLGAYLQEHSERWLRRAPFRYLATTFPVWDLVAALDALELLEDARYDGEHLASFDAAAAKNTFFELLRDR